MKETMDSSEPRRDPEKIERRFLQRYFLQSEGRVIDVGCGDGRLTWLFARKAGLVVGIDIEIDELRNANSTRPEAVSVSVSSMIKRE